MNKPEIVFMAMVSFVNDPKLAKIRPRLKRLDLEYWMLLDLDRHHLAERYPLIEPHSQYPNLGPGCYYSRTLDFAWFVLPNGEWHAYRSGDFTYRLRILSAKELDHRKVAALAGMVKQRLATKTQRALYRDVQDAQEGDAVYRSARKYMLEAR